MIDPLLEISHVVKRYETKVAVHDISLSIPRGEIFGLLGPNGAGKTSLIRMLNRITFPDSGSIRFDGQPLAEQHQRRIGYMPEERGLYKKMKVAEHLVYILQLKGMARKPASEVADKWLNRFDLIEWKDRKVEELSKGMQQKVQFIQTIAHEPGLLILDEPFSGLDPLNAQTMEDTIVELAKGGTTVLFSTHRMEQVEEFCQRIALIHQGKVVLDGHLDAIRQRYRKNVYQLVAEAPFGTLNLPAGVTLENHTGASATLKLSDGNSPRDLIAALNTQLDIRRFELQLPSLRDIFIQTVGAENLTPEQVAQPLPA